MGLPPIIAIVGTNASGKSSLGVRLAQKFNGEIVSADSRQVFKGLDLGSGKISKEEMQGVPHHLLDVAEPNDFFSMADWQRLAYTAIEGIHSKNRLPFIVGGTGLYVASVTEGYLLSSFAPDLEYRNELEQKTTEELAQMLNAALPQNGIDPKNRNRVMRMLEKLKAGDTGVPKSERRYAVLKLGVNWDRETLKARIDARLEKRVTAGMTDEVRRLMAEGARTEFLLKLGLEYKYITRYLLGEYKSEAEMLTELADAIKSFAKRQVTWFKRDKEINWLNMNADPFDEACALIENFLNSEHYA